MKSNAHIATHPIHPMLIPFPLALWVSALIFDLIAKFSGHIALHTVAYYMAIAGCVGAVLAAFPGVVDLLTVIPKGTRASRTGWTHGIINIVVLVLFIISVLTRTTTGLVGGMTRTAYITEIIGVILLGFSGWLGGTLVYDDRIGVPES